MAKRVKAKSVKKRAYESAVRREQAAQTRSRILEAASARFDANGYGRTTIREIAAEAGVAPDTVYATFGSKARVLTALVDTRLTPAEGVSSVLERPEALVIRDEVDQRRQLGLFARDIASISARVRPVYEIMRTASSVEPEMAAVYAEMEGYRRRNMRHMVGWVAANGPLRVRVERATDIVFALASPDVARMLCDGQRWTDKQYADWLEDTLARTLLPDR